MTPEPWTPWISKLAYTSDHSATPNSPETHSFASPLAKDDDLVWMRIRLLVDYKTFLSLRLTRSHHTNIKPGRHHVFVQAKNQAGHPYNQFNTNGPFQTALGSASPGELSVSKADLANIEAPAQRIDSPISSLVCRVQTPPREKTLTARPVVDPT